jgi:hypothetical protein
VDVVVDVLYSLMHAWEMMTEQLKISIKHLKEERVIFLHNSAPF